MAVSVRIEDEAFSDARYIELAEYAGLADADHARSKMEHLWRQCTLETSHVLPASVVRHYLGTNGVEAITRARLGEPAENDKVRIRGTKGRVEWLKQLRDNGKKGGRPPRVRAKPSGYALGLPSGLPETKPDANPPVPAPVPTREERESGKPDAPVLPLRPPYVELAEVAVAEINRLKRSRYEATSTAILKDCRALAKANRTPEQVKTVVASKAKWVGDAKMDEQFKPSVLLRPSNFAKYLDDVNAEPLFANDARRIASRDDDEPDLTYAGMGAGA